MPLLSYLLFRLGLSFFYVIPFSLLYKLSDGVAWLLRAVLKYRLSVVKSNIQKAFPEKNKSDIEKIVKSSYSNLADIFLESLKGMTMRWDKPNARYVFTNPEITAPFIEKNTPTIHAWSHCGNWEWAAYSYHYFFAARVIGFYKPLTNNYIDAFLEKKRASTTAVLADIAKTPRYFLNEIATGGNGIFAMISDQSPTSKKSVWVNFLGIETAFLHGIQLYALKFNLPVFYAHTTRIKRGFYEIRLECITENPNAESENFIVKKYASLLENDIRHAPADWLWSHKRWKLQKDNF